MREKINVMINDPVEVSAGVFKTTITHPKLDGELSFIHGPSNRDQTLGAIQNSIVEDVKEIMETIKEMTGSK